MSRAESGSFPCFLDRLGSRDLHHSERLDSSPHDDDDETEARSCSIHIAKAAFTSYINWKVFCRQLASTSLLLQVLLLLVPSCSFDRDVVFRTRLGRAACLYALQYVLIENGNSSCNPSMNSRFRRDSSYTRKQCFQIVLLSNVLRTFPRILEINHFSSGLWDNVISYFGCNQIVDYLVICAHHFCCW